MKTHPSPHHSPAWPTRLTLAALLLAATHATPLLATPTFEDTTAQRVLACTGCHGKEGRAATDGYYPRIAGKPVGYLYNQLLNFKEGRREYALMTHLISPLTDTYLREFAEHFSALDLPYSAPQAPTVAGDVLRAGEKLAKTGDEARKIPACAQCHGDALTGVSPATPGLLGLPRSYLSAQLGAWKTKQRRAHAPDCMAQVVESLSDADITAVSAWLAAQRVPDDSRPAPSAKAQLPLQCGTAPQAGASAAATPAATPAAAKVKP